MTPQREGGGLANRAVTVCVGEGNRGPEAGMTGARLRTRGAAFEAQHTQVTHKVLPQTDEPGALVHVDEHADAIAARGVRGGAEEQVVARELERLVLRVALVGVVHVDVAASERRRGGREAGGER